MWFLLHTRSLDSNHVQLLPISGSWFPACSWNAKMAARKLVATLSASSPSGQTFESELLSALNWFNIFIQLNLSSRLPLRSSKSAFFTVVHLRPHVFVPLMGLWRQVRHCLMTILGKVDTVSLSGVRCPFRISTSEECNNFASFHCLCETWATCAHGLHCLLHATADYQVSVLSLWQQ